MTGTKPVNFNHTSSQEQFLQSRFIFYYLYHKDKTYTLSGDKRFKNPQRKEHILSLRVSN